MDQDLATSLQIPLSWFDRTAFSTGIRILELVFRAAFKLTVTGKEHLPDRGPLLIAANHLSFMDPFIVLAILPRKILHQLHAIGWEPYFRTRFTRWIARVGHVIPVGPEMPLVTGLRTSAAVLRNGEALLIFPEGERSTEGHLLPFRKGIGVLASELGVPVVPLKIAGTFEAWPPDSTLPRPHPISLHFGKSISITPTMIEGWAAAGQDPHEAAAAMIQDIVAAL